MKIKKPTGPKEPEVKSHHHSSGHIHVPHVGDLKDPRDPAFDRAMKGLFGRSKQICCCGDPSCRIGPFTNTINE